MMCSCSYQGKSCCQRGKKEFLDSLPLQKEWNQLGELCWLEQYFLTPYSFQKWPFLLCVSLPASPDHSLVGEGEPHPPAGREKPRHLLPVLVLQECWAMMELWARLQHLCLCKGLCCASISCHWYISQKLWSRLILQFHCVIQVVS